MRFPHPQFWLLVFVALVLVSDALLSSTLFAEHSATPASCFEDRTAHAGLNMILENARTPEKHQIEIMAGGVAVFDFDNDGFPDIYVANGAEQPSLHKSGPAYSNRLYRNRGDWTFEDVTGKAGVQGEGYDIGVAAADYDNDGYTDLFVAGVRSSTLYRNRGDGTFENVTAKAGIHPSGWAIGAAWFDYDNDGTLDLFIVNYVKWNPSTEPFCGDLSAGYRAYCHPKYYDPLPNQLYHNNGDGTFTDVTESSGIARYLGKGMSAAIADYDGDGRMDLFVANDTVPNFLFHNEGGGRFTDQAMRAGVAYNDDGQALSSMGADFRDLDNDGREDLFITALTNETFPFYRNTGRGLFTDVTYASRSGAATLALSGWGMGIFDFDNDGWKDVFTANGDAQDNTEMFSNRASRQPNLLLLNQRNGRFKDHRVGVPALHRGAAFGDFDRDGRVDVVVTRLNQPPLLLRNSIANGNHWLTIKLTGTHSNRQGIGALIKIQTRNGAQSNRATTAVGYASASEPTVHFGLGSCTIADRVEVDWPSGIRQVQSNVVADRYLTLQEH